MRHTKPAAAAPLRFGTESRPVARAIRIGLCLLIAALFASSWQTSAQVLPRVPQPVPPQSPNQPPGASVMIVDASGSMAARIGNETRLDAARRVLLEQVAGWKPDARLALVAYGHRRESDCQDIETIIPLGAIDLATTKRRLAELRARGRTPLSASLRHAAGLLPPAGGTIFLVSDGLETCNEDPCAVAHDLRAANARLVIHVVGFGLKPEETKALSCIAEQGGGQMASAADAAGLSSALTALAGTAGTSRPRQAEPSQPPPAPPPPVVPEPVRAPEPPPGPVPVSFVAVAAGTDTLVGVPLSWRILAEGVADPVYQGGGEGVAVVLPRGRYRVELTGANTTASQSVAVGDPTGAAIPVRIDLGRLDLSLIAGQGLRLADADLNQPLTWTVTPLDGQRALAEPPTGTSPTLALAPGHYRIAVATGGHTAQAETRIAPGTGTRLELSLRLGRITLEAAADDKADPIAGGTELSWRLTPKPGGPAPGAPSAAGPDSGGPGSASPGSGGPGLGANAHSVDAVARPTLLTPAGTYTVTLLVAGAQLSADGTVRDGATTILRIPLPAGKLTLEAAPAPGAPLFDNWRDATWTVTPIRLLGGLTAGPALTDMAAARPTVTLLPGEWEVVLVSGGTRLRRTITVPPGADTVMRVDVAAFAPGRLTLEAALAAGAPLFDDWRDAQWTVTPVRLQGDATAAAALSEHAEARPTVTLAPGEWQVTLVSGAARASKLVTVASGAASTQRIDLGGGRLTVQAAPLAGPPPDNVLVTVFALAPDGTPVEPPLFTAGTRAEVARVVPAGRYRVTAEDETGRKATRDADIAAGQATSVGLELR